MNHPRHFLLMRCLAASLALPCALAPASAQQPPPVITRPIEVWWGSYRNNEDLVGTNASQWTTVQQNMDGYLLHGAYWNYSNNTIGSPSPTNIGPSLAAILSNKPVMLEHLLAGDYPDVGSAFGNSYAGATNSAAGFSNAIANIRRLKGYGFNLKDVSTDYIMSAWDRAMRLRPAWTSKEMFTALTGDWDGYTGTQFNTNTGSADRNTYGWFRQWVERLAQAFPDVRVTAVNSPVYFPWYDGTNALPELGENFNNYYTWLKVERRGTNFTTFYSADGYGWQQMASTNVDLGAAPRAGFFVSSLTNRPAEGRLDRVKAFPFFAQDLGDPGTPGSVTNFTTNTIDLFASGNNGLHPGTPSRDAQFFAYREFLGDGTFTARLDSLVGSNPARTNASGELPTAGLTLRESIAVGSRQISFHGNTAKQLEFRARGTTAGGLTNVISPVANQGTPPRWLRLVRSNNTVTALNSADGITWITNANVTLTNLAAKLLVGLVCDSQVTFETATANFSQVDFGGQPFPGGSFGGYTSTTIGSAGTNASSVSAGGVFTLDAAGAGVAGTSDNLQYHHLAFTNDGTLYARLQHFADEASPATPLNPGAQLGLMLRADTGASSPQVSVAFTPQQGLLTLARTATSSPTVQVNETGQGLVSIQLFRTGAYRPLLRYFSGNDFLAGLHGAFPGSFSTNFAGFTTDSPYGYQAWGGNETNADAVGHRRKILLYERWLQTQGREHHFIANSIPTGFDTATDAGKDAWDLRYKQDSMRSIQLHQMEGGRPDKVIFESWHEGPFTMVPETKNGSFANLARDGIYFIKGMSGSQRLDLLMQTPGSTNWIGGGTRQTNPSGAQLVSTNAASMGAPLVFNIRLTNSAGVPALPVLHAFETGATNGWTIDYTLTAGSLSNNVTAEIQSNEGQLVTDQAPLAGSELIEAGQTANLEIRVTPTAALAKKKILLRAFWNPQDPSLTPHDAVSLEISPPAELIQNGNFESGTSGWTANGGSIAVVSTNVYDGTNAIKATRSQAYQGPMQDILGRLVPGQTYRLTARVRADSTANFKATVAYVGTSSTNTVFNSVATLSNVSTAWQALQGYYRYTEPNGPTSSLKLYFETTGSPAYTGPIYIDAVSLTLASPVWTDTLPGARGWSTTTSWQSGNAPASYSGNAIAFFPSQNVSTGSITAIQNLGNNFQLNSLTLGGAAPTNGAAATVGINSNSLAFVEHDGAMPSLELVADGSNLSYAVSSPLVLSNNLAVGGDGTANFSFSSPVSGPGSISKTGGSTLTLAASNTFSGGADIAGGAVVASSSGALGTGDILITAGSLRGIDGTNAVLPNNLVLSNNLATGGLLTIDGAVVMAGGNRTVDVGSGSLTLRGTLSDDVARSLVKTGSGTLFLAGSNSFRGYLTIGSGVLRAAHASALPGTNGIDISGGDNIASLDLSGGMSLAKPIQIVMHKQTNSPFGQIRNISGTNVLGETLKLNGGGSRWDVHSLAGLIVFDGAITNLNAGADTWRTLYFSGPGSGIFNGPIHDGGASNSSKLNFTFLSGNWRMAGTNKTYTGNTTVGGSASLWVDCAISSPLFVQSGGILSGVGSTNTSVTLSNGATVLRTLTNWGSAGPGFTAGRVVGAPGLSNWTILLNAAGLAGFSETTNTVPVFSGSLSNISAGSISLAFSGFTGAGTWSVQTNTNSLSLLYIPASPDLFQAWSNGIAWNGKPSGPHDDPDFDGLSNLAEYAFAGDPVGGSNDSGRPTVSIVNDRLTVKFNRVADPSLTYEVFATDDLSSAGAMIWSSTGVENVAGPVTVTDTVTTQGRPKRFVRVRITR